MIEVIRGDITTLDVDAIVNAANSALIPGGGVDGAINRAAGPQLASAMAAFRGCETGRAVITPGFSLKAKYVIHAVGPNWHGGNNGEDEDLRSAYEAAFDRAESATDPPIRSVAFPSISTGVYGFPKDRAADIAVSVMRAHESRFDRIIACVFDDDSLRLYRDRLNRPR